MKGLREASVDEAGACWESPERVVLAVSVDEEGRADIIALGWKMYTSSYPRMVAISVGKTRHSHGLISQGGEFVLAIPGEDMAEAVLYCGTHSGRDVDKFREAKLTPCRARFVKPPLIEECIANMECRVVGKLDTGDHTIFVGEIVASWVSEERKRNLLCIGYESGYEYVGGGEGYRFGVIKR